MSETSQAADVTGWMNDGLPDAAGFASPPMWGKKPELSSREGEEEERRRRWRRGEGAWKRRQMEDAAVAGGQGTQFMAPVGRD